MRSFKKIFAKAAGSAAALGGTSLRRCTSFFTVRQGAAVSRVELADILYMEVFDHRDYLDMPTYASPSSERFQETYYIPVPECCFYTGCYFLDIF